MKKLFLLIFASLFMFSLVSAFDWTNGLVGYYNFNSDSTDSLKLLNGTDTAVSYVAGKIGNSASFDGATSYIVLPNSTKHSIAQNLTLAYWVYMDGTGTAQGRTHSKSIDYFNIMGHDTGVGYFATTTTSGTANTGTTTINISNGWHFLIMGQNQTHRYIYIDGVLNKNSTIPSDIIITNSQLYFGSNAGSSEFYKGKIDELGIWNRSLSNSEILELYNGGSGLGYLSTSVNVVLNSPINNSVISSNKINFTSTFNITGDNSYGYSWNNATLYLWFNNGTLFSSNFTTLAGTNNQTTRTLEGITTGNYLWNYVAYYGNATYKNTTSALTNNTFQWRPFEIVSQNYTSAAYETQNKNFSTVITTLPSILTVISKLNYNGTLYSASTSCVSGTCNINSVIDIPLVTSGEYQNKSFYWQINVYDGSSTYSFDTTEQLIQQNVSRIHLEECNSTYTIPTVNFTSYIEKNLTKVNPFRIAGTFDYWLGSGDVMRSSSFNKGSTENLTLCISPSDSTYYSNAQIEYGAVDNETYVMRNYWFQNESLTSSKQEISLFQIEPADSTTFIIKVQDQKLSPVEDALVYIQRYYPSDGQYRTVQIAKTDNNGETVGFYQTETVDYKHIIIKDGEVLLNTTAQKVVGKSTPYTLTFTTGGALGYPWTSFEKGENIQSNLTFNKTSKIITFSYIDLLGFATSGRLYVFEQSNSNSSQRTICNVSTSQSSATLTCDISSESGIFYAYGYIDGEVIDVDSFVNTTARDVMGLDGLFMGFMIILVAGFAFIWNPTAGIIGINAAMIFTNLMGFITVSPIFIFGGIAVSIIAIILLKS